MKKLVVAFILTVAWITSRAEPVLLGRWQSDRQLTMAFARDHAKLEEKTVLFLEQLMGRMTLKFTQSQIASVMPNWQSETAEGVKSNLIGFTDSSIQSDRDYRHADCNIIHRADHPPQGDYCLQLR